MTVEPIKPSEVSEHNSVPEEVITVVNKLIRENINNGVAAIKQDDIITEVLKISFYTRQQIFHKGWLNIEDIYREAGWKVTYDKPAYNENYPATFTFRKT